MIDSQLLAFSCTDVRNYSVSGSRPGLDVRSSAPNVRFDARWTITLESFVARRNASIAGIALVPIVSRILAAS